ncbi:glycerophosphodiester phosphodiesterase family protein (plasmid) [Deinococcus sp. VB343]|uniref:Glycerophosphodiester phosphodiesterase family protein n=1 Tax=Deinococcus sp. VB142 TaxID=3112952 RepID=A0AAU6Q7P2_9DEIO
MSGDNQPGSRFGAENHHRENYRINDVLSRNRPAIAVHRGSPGGSIVDNTVAAVKAALRQGADIVEIDVVRSTDGDFFCFHDGYEMHHFGVSQNIRTMSTAQIEALNYSWARHSGYPVERLETMLQQFPDTILNIDRSWWFWDTLLPFLDQRAEVSNILLKAPLGEHVKLLTQHATAYPFMPICYSVEEVDEVIRLARTTSLNLVGLELIARDSSSPFVSSDYIRELQEQRLFVLANALNLADCNPLYADMDDESSVLHDPAQGWGKMAALGVDVIHTDWPLLLLQHLEGAGYRKGQE